MKKGTILKRGITLLLSAALTLTIAPVVSNDTTAQAASATDQGEVTAYAAKESLLNDYAAKKKNDWLVFGKDENGQALSWYILGKDSGVSGDNIALIAANDIKKKQAFQSDTTNNQTYSYPAGTGYGDSAGTIEVYPNHYGASELRKALQSMAKDTAYFSTGEQSLMQETTIPNRDIKNGKAYDTSDVLYVPMGVTTNGNKDQTVYVESGNSRAFDRYDRAGSYIYWLRYPSDGNRMCTLAIASSSMRDSVSVSAWVNTEMLPVRPATNLDVSDVLFASAAQAATTDQVNTGKMFEDCTDEIAMKDTDSMNTYGRKPWVSRAMTLRMDGRNRKIGSVSYENETGMIHAQKDPAAGL
ncbi:MAG: hypothetical protein MR425_08790 [Lachnospiraceae bacterium]|nr:hypothetical protein [Lachnospiraceae bacterium]